MVARNTVYRGPAVSAGISLPMDLLLAAREQATREGIPFSRVVRKALEAFLASDEELAPTSTESSTPA